MAQFFTISVMIVLFPAMASSYDLETHEDLSRGAFQVSGIATTLEQAYGIRSTADTYRGRLPFFLWERHTPVDWVANGGRDEDSPVWRVLNHFYDPHHDVPLTLGVALGERAPDWALEDQQNFVLQRHSYQDARNALYIGLTAADPTARERELGHTFYALGHVIHTIQDMAQPQHTRNDAHLSPGPAASWLEKYVDRNNQAFPLSGASIPNVSSARDLWVTVPRSGIGLAEFSNANFVSAGTNFTEPLTGATAEQFPSPVLNLADSSTTAPGDVCRDGTPAPGGGPLTFYGNAFSDPVSGASLHNARMTTFSIFDQRLQARGVPLVFALNCFNLDTQADILLPRAVSYSAALLKYFFRGTFDVALASNSARITNRTPGETMSGQVNFYYDTVTGERVRLAGPFDVTLAPDASSGSLSLPPPLPNKPPARPGRYLVVFKGTLGNEGDIAVAAKLTDRPAWVQVVTQHSEPGGSTTGIIGGYEPTSLDLAEGPVTLEAFHSQSKASSCLGPEEFVETLIYRSTAVYPGTTMRLTITIENNDPSIGYVTVGVGGFLSANATLVGAETWGYDSDDPGGTVVAFGAQFDITDSGTYDIPVGAAQFFRVWGNASFPPCPPGGTRSVRGIIVGLEFMD